MKSTQLSILILLASLIALSGCGSKSDNSANAPQPAPSAQAPASQPAGQPAASSPQQPATTQQAATPPTEPPPPPPKPPEPKKYILAAGTPISVRTISDVNTKSATSGNEFEATLESALVADGHTLAKRGATVVGRVVNADQGGRVKGKASLTLTLARLHLANGQNVAIQSNTVTQTAKSGTGKNLKRTGIATGAGALIGGIAGGGKGAAIGAGVGAGAGVATNLATRGPAAEIPPETVLNFSLAKDIVVTVRQ
jgi:hypothetical protein